MRWVWVAFAVAFLVGASVAGSVGTATAATAPDSASDGPAATATRPDTSAGPGSLAPRSGASTGTLRSSASMGALRSGASTGALRSGSPPGNDAGSVSVRANATYAPGEDVTVRLSGQQGRLYALYLYDANGTHVATNRTSLHADVETISFGGLDSGSYRVVVVEAYTGVQVTDAFGVGGAYQSGVVPELTVDQPADVVTVPLALPNGTTRATVALGDDRGEYRVAATVVDGDRDGRVVLDWNTFYAGRGSVALRARGDDAVVDATRERDLDGFLPEREYHLVVRANGTVLDRGAILVHIEPLYTSQIDVYEAPDAGSPAASLEEAVSTGRVETDEWLFVVVRTEGIFGAVNATRDLRSVGPDQTVLSITPEDGGDGVRLIDADYVHVEEGRIVVGFAPGNRALAVDTQYDVDFLVTRAHPYRGGDDTKNANVRIVPAGSEPDRPVVRLESVDAPRSVPADALANFTITLVNRGERTGTIPVSVTIGGHTVATNVTVHGNGRAVVELTFDASRVLEGNRTYVVEANDSRHTGSIVVGDASRDDGPTLGEYDRGGDSLPGFSAPVAVAALAVVLAVARRRATR